MAKTFKQKMYLEDNSPALALVLTVTILTVFAALLAFFGVKLAVGFLALVSVLTLWLYLKAFLAGYKEAGEEDE